MTVRPTNSWVCEAVPQSRLWAPTPTIQIFMQMLRMCLRAGTFNRLVKVFAGITWWWWGGCQEVIYKSEAKTGAHIFQGTDCGVFLEGVVQTLQQHRRVFGTVTKPSLLSPIWDGGAAAYTFEWGQL